MSPRTVSNEDKKLGLLVRTRRNAAGLSQTDLGAKLGVTFQQIQKYEKGVNRISATRLQQIANALKEDISYFQNAGTITDHMLEFGKAAASAHGVRLMKAFTQINNSTTELLLIHIAENLAELSVLQRGDEV